MKKPSTHLAILRHNRYLSQKDVASLLGISQQYYGRLEKNPDKIDMGLAKKLKILLNVSYIDDLLEKAV